MNKIQEDLQITETKIEIQESIPEHAFDSGRRFYKQSKKQKKIQTFQAPHSHLSRPFEHQNAIITRFAFGERNPEVEPERLRGDRRI